MKILDHNQKRFYLIAILLCLVSLFANAQKSFALSPPTFLQNGGLCTNAATVELSGPGGTIFFTTDGTTPTTSSQVYSSSFTVYSTTTIKAIAVLSGVSSPVATATFTFDPQITNIIGALVWLRSDLGVTSNAGTVSNWLNSDGFNQYYIASQATLSKQPSLLSNALNGHSAIQTSTNKYFNLAEVVHLDNLSCYLVTKPNSSSTGSLIDFTPSNTSTDQINFSTTGPAATFTINQGTTPASITASSAVSVGQYQVLSAQQLSSTNYGIYNNGLLQYSGTLAPPPSSVYVYNWNHIGTDYTLSNFYDGNFCEIMIANSSYNDQKEPYLLTRYQILTQNPAPPILSVPSSSLSGPTQVAISVPADSICKFTLDGTTPTSASPSYEEPINIYYSQNLNAIAIKNGFSSSVVSATYTLDSTQWPAPNSSDTTPLQVNIQSPN